MPRPQQQQPQASAQEREVLATGSLNYGVQYQGRRHYDFAMSLPTMGDNIDALEAFPDGSGARVDLVMFAACMIRLGDIPADDIDFELLASMDPADVDVIYATLAEAKKKLLQPRKNSASTESSFSSSESTESQKTASVA